MHPTAVSRIRHILCTVVQRCISENATRYKLDSRKDRCPLISHGSGAPGCLEERQSELVRNGLYTVSCASSSSL